jgi:hypothetical protein
MKKRALLLKRPKLTKAASPPYFVLIVLNVTKTKASRGKLSGGGVV